MSSGIVAEIKSKLPVVDIVGETVTLKRAGAAWKGICPFHAEKTPSFIVAPERETWHCFGCGEHGDIFTFVMRRDGLEFREALRQLAERAGVELSERTASEDRQRRRLREALEGAIAWYREVLLQARQAERARAYLAERGLSEETLERFTIGYAPNTWDALTRRLRERGFTDADLAGAGLASPSNRGGVYDRFRGRIIIPIRDASGRAIGLGGRVMPGAEGPKYVNSPATLLFDKSRTLFAIDLAKGAIRREGLAVIVEGYTDVMAAHQAGFGNVVASQGTALTRGQVELATRYADAVALAYDVDLAGEAATQRGLLDELGPDTAVSKVRVVRIPAGKDPDELLRADPDAWRQAVAEAKPVMEYFMERAAAAVDMGSAAGRTRFVERVLAVLRRIPDRVEQDAYVPEVAKTSGVDERVLREALARPAPATARRAIPVESAPIAVATPVAERLSVSERRLLTLVLRYPALTLAEVGEDDLGDAAAVQLLADWRRHVAAGSGGDLRAFVESLDPASGELARSLLAVGEPMAGVEADVVRLEVREVVRRMRREAIERRIESAESVIRASDGGDITELERTLHELYRRREELNLIKEPAGAGGRSD